MFGYVKAYTPYMRVCELEMYKSIYCGLCKTLSARFGALASLTLSYDLVFLAIVRLGADNADINVCKRRCPLHPLVGKPCAAAEQSEAFEYSADASVILTYHKLRDDLKDKGLKSKLRAVVLLPFYAKLYKKAAKCRRDLAQAVERAMKEQFALENADEHSLDAAAEPTAAIMRAVFRCAAGNDPDKRDDHGRFGYLLGRYVYICDAIDDLRSDISRGEYNPLIEKNCRYAEPEKIRAAALFARDSISLTLGALAEAYQKLDIGRFKPLTDNIIYLGLRHTFMQTAKKQLRSSLEQQTGTKKKGLIK